MKASSKLYLTFSERLFFTFSHELYAYRERGMAWSWGNEILLGVNILTDFRLPLLFGSR